MAAPAFIPHDGLIRPPVDLICINPRLQAISHNAHTT